MVTEGAALAPLTTFAANVHSQNGEDGIIQEILTRLGRQRPLDKWCVEIGAWDGFFLSNTCKLITEQGYSAVLIEGDPVRFRELCQNLPQPNVHKICQFVTLEGAATMDEVLKGTPLPVDFDLMSIDIDGCDYFIFESLQIYRPKVVCIEFNPTIPNEIDFIQARDFGIKQGTSARPLVALAQAKGYTLVTATLCNLLFVRNELADAVIGAARPTLESVRDDARFRAFLFVAFDGTILSNKSRIEMPWHHTSYDLERFQQLPKVLRRYSHDYTRWQRLYFMLLHPANLRVEIRRLWNKWFAPGRARNSVKM
jgi:hypothetical protein